MFFYLLWIPIFGLIAEPVTKRGFIVKDQEGILYLSQVPGVKSCCVKKDNDAIELVGDFGEHSAYCAVSLTGNLVEESGRLKLVSNRFTIVDNTTEEALSE